MSLKKFIVFLPLLALLTTCKKHKYPESVVINEPVYYSELAINGRGTKISAGENGYFQYSTYAKDSDLVYVMRSAIANSTCETCEQSIEFNFHDISINKNGAGVAIDSVLRIGNKEFVREGRGPSYIADFRGAYNLPTVSTNMTWDFGDGTTGQGNVVSHTYKIAGNYNVCLTTKGTKGCSSSLCNVFTVGGTAPLVNIAHINYLDSATFSTSVLSGKAPLSYTWDFGDGGRSTLASPSHAYKVTGAYPVVLQVKDGNGKLSTYNYNFVSGKDLSSCATNYSISALAASTNGSQNFSKVELKYRAENGVLYSSSKIDQSADSKFEIVSVSDGGTNENGDKLKKVEIKYSALVSNGVETITISNGKATIAVAYK